MKLIITLLLFVSLLPAYAAIMDGNCRDSQGSFRGEIIFREARHTQVVVGIRDRADYLNRGLAITFPRLELSGHKVVAQYSHPHYAGIGSEASRLEFDGALIRLTTLVRNAPNGSFNLSVSCLLDVPRDRQELGRLVREMNTH